MRWWMPAAVVGAASIIIVAIVAVQEAQGAGPSREERLRAQLSSGGGPAAYADLAELLLAPEAPGTPVPKERLAEGRALAERALMLAPNTAGA